jgi:hypothetical protein
MSYCVEYRARAFDALIQDVAVHWHRKVQVCVACTALCQQMQWQQQQSIGSGNAVVWTNLSKLLLIGCPHAVCSMNVIAAMAVGTLVAKPVPFRTPRPPESVSGQHCQQSTKPSSLGVLANLGLAE